MPLSSPGGYRKRDDWTGRQFGGDGPIILIGKTTAAHAKGASGAVRLYFRGTKGAETDSGKDLTVYNRYADIESGKWVTFAWVGNGYEMLAGEC